MNEVKLVKYFACNRLSAEQLAEKFQISVPEVFKSIRQFIKHFSHLEWSKKVNKMYKCDLIRMFVATNLRVDEFVETIGMSEPRFIEFIRDIVEDRDIIQSDTLADRIYRKAMERKRISCNFIPERIVQYIAYRYVSDSHITQTSVGKFYGISNVTVGNTLRRGIAEDIVDEETADLIFAKVRNFTHHHVSPAVINAYMAAFDKRAQVQHDKKIKHLEALFESDDPNIDYPQVEATLKKLKG